jgi:hypothetical protein
MHFVILFYFCVSRNNSSSSQRIKTGNASKDDERESDDEMLEDTLKRWTEHRSSTAQESGATGLCCSADSRSRSKTKRHAEWHVATLWDGTS